MIACDATWQFADAGSIYEEYGGTCGGRSPVPLPNQCYQTITDPLLP